MPGSTRHYRVSASQPGGCRRAVGYRFGGDRRPRRTGRAAQHPCPAACGRGDDLEHGVGDRPSRRRGGQRDGDDAARGDERTVVHGREPVRAGWRGPRPCAGRPGGPRRPLRRHLVYDAVGGLRRTATVGHGHAVGELGRGRVPLPRRTRPEHLRLEGQHGQRPRRHRRARGAGPPGGCRGLVLLGQLRLHRQDRRQPGEGHLRHHHGQRASLYGVVLRRWRRLGVGLGRTRPGRHRRRRRARRLPHHPREPADGGWGRQLPSCSRAARAAYASRPRAGTARSRSTAAGRSRR